MKKAEIIDIFITVIDNYGDMGFACEFISAIEREYGEQYECVVWTDDAMAMREFVSRSGLGEVAIGDIAEFWILRKSVIGISILHAPIPDMDFFAPRALILRIDYLSLDTSWISQNGTEHITSTRDRQIIELIPSVLEGGAGLIAPVSLSSRMQQSEADWSKVMKVPGHGLLHSKGISNASQRDTTSQWPVQQKHITIFTYPSTIDRIDWDSFPSDLIVYVYSSSDTLTFQHPHIRVFHFLPTHEYYTLLDTSEFAIIRWEVSWAHMIQGSVPFLWDMYQGIGGWPSEQSEQFLEFIWASPDYRWVHKILSGQKQWKITYTDILWALSHTRFVPRRTHNLIHTVKKHIDRFQNSI